MPSVDHEALVLLFRNRPELAAELLAVALGHEVVAFDEARVANVDQTEVQPATRLADVVIELRRAGGPALAVVVEVQLATDSRKRYTWPLYVASVRAELECDTWLLVVTPDESVEAWAAQAIEMGQPGHALLPIVIGPGRIPAIRDPEIAARSPELSVLSALAHRSGDVGFDVASALLRVLADRVDEDRAASYTALVLARLDIAVRARLEEAMKIEGLPDPPDWFMQLLRLRREAEEAWRAEWRAEGRAEGAVRAKAESVLAVLEARGLEVTDDLRARVLACTEPETLSRWLVRAATVDRPGDIFDG